MGDERMPAKEDCSLLEGQVEHLSNVLAPVGNFEGFRVIPSAFAHRAGGFDVRHELQRCRDGAGSATLLAPSAFHVETESRGGITPFAGEGLLGEQAPNLVVEADVGSGIGTRRTADRRLIDVDHVTEVVETFYRVVS